MAAFLLDLTHVANVGRVHEVLVSEVERHGRKGVGWDYGPSILFPSRADPREQRQVGWVRILVRGHVRMGECLNLETSRIHRLGILAASRS